MARAYVDALSDVTAEFPSAVYTPRERLNYDTGRASRSETIAVPGAANDYTVELDYAPLEQTSFGVTVDGVAQALVPWTRSPAAGECAVSFDLPLVRFHSSAEGDTAVITYVPACSVDTAQFMNQLQREIAAAQFAMSGMSAQQARAYLQGEPVEGQVCGYLYVDLAGKSSRTLKRYTATAANVVNEDDLNLQIRPAGGGAGTNITALEAAAKYGNGDVTGGIVASASGWYEVYCSGNGALYSDINLTTIWE